MVSTEEDDDTWLDIEHGDDIKENVTLGSTIPGPNIIVHNVNANLEPGSLVAIIGPTGCGN